VKNGRKKSLSYFIKEDNYKTKRKFSNEEETGIREKRTNAKRRKASQGSRAILVKWRDA